MNLRPLAPEKWSMLKWSDLDCERGVISLDKPKARAEGTVDTIPLPPRLMALLETIRTPPDADAPPSPYVFPGKDGGPLTDGKRQWQRLRKLAGLEKYRFHDLRHTFATLIASTGEVDLRVLQSLLNHKSIDMTMRYAHLFDARLKQAGAVSGDAIEGIVGKDAFAMTTPRPVPALAAVAQPRVVAVVKRTRENGKVARHVDRTGKVRSTKKRGKA